MRGGAVTKGHGGGFRTLALVLLVASGIGLAGPGTYLLSLGGSAYYLVAGSLLLLSAILIARRKRAGLTLFWLLFLGTLLWSLWEVGLDGWALMPRLAFLVVAGLVLSLPQVQRGMPPPNRWMRMIVRVTFLLLAVVAAVMLYRAFDADARGTGPSAMVLPSDAGDGDWQSYGSTLGGTRYSRLVEITPANVATLEKAWTFRPGLNMPGGTRKGGLQMTPLMVDGILYGCTAFSSVFALDPATGRQLWRHDPPIAEGSGGHPACRGIAYFRASATATKTVTDCPARLLLGTIANRLIALDARTGRPCRSFGAEGQVDLLEGIGDFPRRWAHPTSPPTIVNGTAIIGGYVADNQSTQVPPGVIRGYDAVTGALKWAFDPARPDARGPLAPGAVYTPSTPNMWSIASGDEALGLVYLPMGNGSPDFFGGYRSPTTERFSSALVALDARTGAVRWTFQTVHHDLWDYDLAAQPVLTDFPTGSGTTPALVLATKTGQIFVLDRRTGRPLTRVEERRVPASTVPGERASPTQPFSVGMPDFAGPDLTERDMWGLTPFDQLYCRIKFRQADYRGRFTPPRLGPSIRYPGELGGIDWGSVSVDEGRRILIVNSNHMADYDALITRAQAQAEGLVPKTDPKVHRAPGAAMAGTPYAVHWSAFMSGLEVPCQRPPYGFLSAVDLKTRKILWRKPVGDARNSGPFGMALHLPLPLGAPNIGGTVTTAGGVLFIAATQDEMLRAFDIRTGARLWETRLPVAGHATPMTYRARDGRQYILIAAGGGSLRDRQGDYIIAYRLPR